MDSNNLFTNMTQTGCFEENLTAVCKCISSTLCSFVKKSAKLSSLYSWKISFPYLLSVEASALITKRLWYNFLLEVRKLWWWFKPQIYMFLNEWSDINNSIRLIGKAYGYWLRMFFVCNHRFTFDFQLWNEFEVKDFHSSYDIAWNW